MNTRTAVFPDSSQDKLITRRLLIYLGVTFAISWLWEFLVVWPAANGESTWIPSSLTSYAVAVVMLVPALSVLITRLVTKEGFKNCWIVPKDFKKTWWLWLAAWFGPAVLTLLGSLLYFLIFPGQYDSSLGYFQIIMMFSGYSLDTDALRNLIWIQITVAALLGPLINILTCFGEEWGWRGYLLPKMSLKLKTLPMLLVNGVIWGIWHAPMTALGHNYGTGYWGFPWTGILMMCGFCIVFGTLFSYVTLKTGSCIPAAFAHGGLNSIASAGIYFTTSGGNAFVGPAVTGIIGGLPALILAGFLAWRMMKQTEADDEIIISIEEKARFTENKPEQKEA